MAGLFKTTGDHESATTSKAFAMRVTILLLSAAMTGCGMNGDAGPPAPVAGSPKPPPNRIKTWEAYSSGVYGYKVQFPKGERNDFDETSRLLDRNVINQYSNVFALEHDLEKLKAGEFVARYVYRVLAFKVRTKARKDAADALIDEQVTHHLGLKGRATSATREVTWAGQPATETVYEASEGKPRVTLRRCGTAGDGYGRVYVAGVLEPFEPSADDVAKFFDSFELLPLKQ